MTDARFLRYDAADEAVEPGEAQAVASINRSMHGILETTWADYGHSVRSVHAKSHGLLEGELRVLDGLPEHLAQGLFAKPARYPVVLRISTNPGDILDDTVSSPRGLAIKVIGVEGERLPGASGAATQDFVLVNGPAFVAPDAQRFERNLKLLAATTDTGQAWKKAFSALLRGVSGVLATAGTESGAVKAMGGHPLTHPLGETFYSQTPFRYGEHVAKFSVAPVSPELVELKDEAVDLGGRPNGLRDAVNDFFWAHGGTWEVRVQLRTDLDTMPIEDATVQWPEDASPYVAVARIVVDAQPAWSEARAKQVDDGLAFSPWHGLAAHRPLGSINRARQEAYALSARFRGEHNGCPMHEPEGRIGLSGDAAATFGTAPGREGRRPRTPDARRGVVGQKLNARARKVTAGAAGGLAAGALLSVLFLGLEAATGTTSDLVRLKRRARKRAGYWDKRGDRRDGAPPELGELVASHAGHLALSAAAGAVYGAVKPDGARPVVAGAALGAGFFGLAFGVIGPALRVSTPLSRDTTKNNVQHGLFHLLFGVATALVAERVSRRI